MTSNSSSKRIELGLGLISIGRPWGYRPGLPPSENAAFALLERASSLGIRFFDTAPAYGKSETTLGRFFQRFVDVQKQCVISTKMGENWHEATQASTVNHQLDFLKRSIDNSLAALGRIDILQVHKATADVLSSDDVAKAVEYARTCGIKQFGASVSDVAAATVASELEWCSYLQFPFNHLNTKLQPIFAIAAKKPLKLLINRPLAMGEIASGDGAGSAINEAFAFIKAQPFEGIVLTGTKSVSHLAENYEAFHKA